MPEMKENLFHFAKEDIEKVENSNSAIARIMERIVISMSVKIINQLIEKAKNKRKKQSQAQHSKSAQISHRIMSLEVFS